MSKIPAAHMANEEPIVHQAEESDSRILFTDVVDIVVNNYGVVMKFLQGAGPGSQPSVVAKVGMSREHAKSVLHILQVTLNQTERTTVGPKKLNSPNESRNN